MQRGNYSHFQRSQEDSITETSRFALTTQLSIPKKVQEEDSQESPEIKD